MKINVTGKATIDITIEDMDAKEARSLLDGLLKLDSILPDPLPQTVRMFMDGLSQGLQYAYSGHRLHYDEEL